MMKRNIRIEEISDGRFYTSQDMVRADCHGCQGCASCCSGMGESLVLDPLDVWNLKKQLKKTFEELMQMAVDLNVVDGIILPNIRMTGEDEKCAFLNPEGRCSVHAFRPGICRLFPLGRIYEDGGFKYFLQVHECPEPNKSKVRVRQWIGIDHIKEYEAFVSAWHYFLKDIENLIQTAEDESQIRTLNMYLLRLFFVQDYDAHEDFYGQFYQRLEKVKSIFAL